MNNFDELHQNRKTFSKIFFYSIAGVFAFFLLLRFFVENSGVVVSEGILFFGFFLTVYTAYLLSKTKYDFLKLYRILTFFLGFFICYVSLLISDISKAVHFLFVPITLLIMLISKFNRAVFWGIFFLIFSIISSKISSYLQMGIPKDIFANKPETLLFQEYIVIVISVYFSFVILYYHDFFKSEREKIATLSLQKNSSLENIPLKIMEQDEDEDKDLETSQEAFDKDQILYKKIIEYFDTEKPYQSPDFNIRKLANLLDSNSTYVSKALNKIGNKKFNQLVNEYRIDQVKREIAENIHQKFTLEHIYTNAGFSQQATFNRIFKEQTGLTPSDYIEKLNFVNNP